MEMDMLVLMAGMEMAEDAVKLADEAKLKRGENRFFQPADHHFGTNMGNVRGVFYAGACTAPLNITETISHARSAVMEIVNYLNSAK
jgi:heterodisulfide reductase subunit A-like polyferredoxin